MVCAIPTRQSFSPTYRSAYFVPRAEVRPAITRLAFIPRIALDPPHRRSLPACLGRARGNLPFVQHPRNRIDTQPLLCICLEHEPNHLCLSFDHLVISSGGLGLPHIPVSIGSTGKHVNHALVCLVPLPPTTALGDLRSFVFGNHALELHQKLVFRSGSRGRLQKDQLHPAA